jgi:hypothetical protein
MTEPTVKVFSLRNENRFPVACVAYTQTEDEAIFAVSTHNPKDCFNKKLGRHIAVSRLTNGSWLSDTVKVEGDIKVNILSAILCYDKFPQRTQEAALLWLKTPRTQPQAEAVVVDEVAEAHAQESEQLGHMYEEMVANTRKECTSPSRNEKEATQ